MNRSLAAKSFWAFLAAPFAVIFLVTLTATWPLGLENSALRLGLIAYVIACPLMPMLWRGSRVVGVLLAGLLAVGLQILAVGIVNFWF
jgi:hypothetical protein